MILYKGTYMHDYAMSDFYLFRYFAFEHPFLNFTDGKKENVSGYWFL